MTKFKNPPQEYLLQVCDILVLLTNDTPCHIQVLCSDLYDILSIRHGNLGCFTIVNGDRNLVRDLEERIVPGHNGGAFWIL